LTLAGCAQDNEKAMNTDTVTGKSTGQGVTPPTAAKSSAEFNKKNQPAMNDAANAAKYKAQQQ